jgi:hypothetical protein
MSYNLLDHSFLRSHKTQTTASSQLKQVDLTTSRMGNKQAQDVFLIFKNSPNARRLMPSKRF